MPNQNADTNYLDMADDEISSMSAPNGSIDLNVGEDEKRDRGEDGHVEDVHENEIVEASQANESDEEDDAPEPSPKDTEEDPDEEEEDASDDDEPEEGAKSKPPSGGDEDESDSEDSAEEEAISDDSEGSEEEKPKEIDHKAFYERIIGSPIKANGKEITLENEDEAIRLIQMGANYTKNMQKLRPALRVVKMLENNELLDEKKLAHLIDLDKGNPQAIQKLLADKNFDSLSIDEEEAAKYEPGNHQVSDAEMKFNHVLDELENSDEGLDLIHEVSTQWDRESKQAVFQDPNILNILHEHRANGLYSVVKAEVDRQEALGYLNGVPFLQAYNAVGDMLAKQGKLNTQPPVQQAPPEPVATRTVAPKPPVKNSKKARGAMPTRASAPKPKKSTIDYLDMPDDQFLAQMEDRL